MTGARLRYEPWQPHFSLFIYVNERENMKEKIESSSLVTIAFTCLNGESGRQFFNLALLLFRSFYVSLYFIIPLLSTSSYVWKE